LRARRQPRFRAKTTALIAIAGSTFLHGSLLLMLLLRPEPPPRLVIALSGPGRGEVTAAGEELHCGERCAARFAVGAEIVLKASPEEGSTFEGWGEGCDASADPLSCRLVISGDIRVEARFGVPPEEVEVAWLADDELPPPARTPLEMALPELAMPEVEEDGPPEPPEEVAEEVEVAQAEPRPEPSQPERSNLKAVEVPNDDDVVDEAPDHARFLSDQNRDVAQETHAQDTNLERHADGEAPASEPSEIDSDEVGGPEDVIAHLETSEPTRPEPELEPESAHSGEDDQAAGAIVGEGGEGGAEEAGDAEPEQPSMLSMRDVDRLDMPGGALAEPEAPRPRAPGRRGLDTRLPEDAYERIVGEDRVREEQELGRRRMSQRQGSWERRQQALRASLENFTPEVRPGNQTALATRAEPFALYIARMHRRIHERWGFGFIEELSRKPASHELNDWRLHTKLEIVIGPDGDVERTTIVQTSGLLTFDVAAIDAVQSAGPYEPPPQAIRSGNGRVYVHWSFHRDWRQCGTFGAHPFILDNAGEADRGIDDGRMLEGLPGRSSGGGSAGSTRASGRP
jgi:outer membrane biosynthesis protein TonB